MFRSKKKTKTTNETKSPKKNVFEQQIPFFKEMIGFNSFFRRGSLMRFFTLVTKISWVVLDSMSWEQTDN